MSQNGESSRAHRAAKQGLRDALTLSSSLSEALPAIIAKFARRVPYLTRSVREQRETHHKPGYCRRKESSLTSSRVCIPSSCFLQEPLAMYINRLHDLPFVLKIIKPSSTLSSSAHSIFQLQLTNQQPPNNPTTKMKLQILALILATATASPTTPSMPSPRPQFLQVHIYSQSSNSITAGDAPANPEAPGVFAEFNRIISLTSAARNASAETGAGALEARACNRVSDPCCPDGANSCVDDFCKLGDGINYFACLLGMSPLAMEGLFLVR